MTFAVLLKERARREVEEVRAFLGAARARAFDDKLAQILERLEAHPKLGGPAFLGGRWSKSVRKLIVGRTGYLLFYRVRERAALVEVLSIWHERRRPPRL